MNLNSSLKKIICFLLAVLMVVSVVGCKNDGSSKKKVIKKVKKKVIVVNDDEQTDNSGNNIIVEDTTNENEQETVKARPKRPLPEVAEEEEEYVEPIIPEFDYDYAALNITSDYVIVYSFEQWKNRYESRNEDGSDRAITATGFNRLKAYDLQEYFKDNYNLNLEVQKDTVVAKDAKKILVGDTEYYTTKLGENEFAVKVVGDDLVFEGGHFVMVEKAVDWYQTVKIQSGKVATLSGKQDDFRATVTLNGITYDYVWGDEFDGSEFNDDDKWVQGTFGLERQDDMVNIYNDSQFQYVENGRLRLTGDRYYDEGNGNIGYATSGEIETDGVMLFRNGYFEFRARLPYTRGAFPAIWTLTTPGESFLKNVPNWNYNDGYGLYKNRVWDLEFDLFEAFADEDHMTTTIHKWYKNESGLTTIGQTLQVLTLEEQQMVENDMVDYRKAYKTTYSTPLKYTYKDAESNDVGYSYIVDSNNKIIYLTEEELEVYAADYEAAEGVTPTYGHYLNGSLIKSENMVPVTKEQRDALVAKNPNIAETAKPAYARYAVTLNFEDGAIDTFKYRLNPFTNMKTSMATYAYSFSYNSGTNVNHGVDGTYNWSWYFDPETINQEYHVYAFQTTSTHCTVYMDGEPFLDFDWDPAYDYKDLDGDGKGDDISRNNNGVGFNFWQYFIIDMMIYTPGNFNIADVKKLQDGDVPLNLYIDYVRCYQDLDDPSQALYYPKGQAD